MWEVLVSIPLPGTAITNQGYKDCSLLKNGKVVEDRMHRDLITGSGEYADLWSRQTRDPEDDMFD